MEPFFLGWLLLALTTSLTALVRVYHPVLKKLRAEFPNTKYILPKNTIIGGLACFIFSLVVFPAMLGILFVDDYRTTFINELTITLSQD